METNPSGISLEKSRQTWETLTALVEAFIAAWERQAEPPRLEDFLPAHPPALRRLVLVELIKVDLEYRWLQAKLPRRVEEYVSDFPELREGGIPCDLLYDEFHVRKQAGETVEPKEYVRRFPEKAADLQRLFGMEVTCASLVRTQLRADLQPGEQLDDFHLRMLLGKGAFAKVFLASQTSLQRTVALKISADRGAEPQTLAQLDHPSIVRVHDQRTLAGRGLRLMYMPLIPGGTMQQVIAHARSVPADQRTGLTLLEAIDRHLEKVGLFPPPASANRTRLAVFSWTEMVCWVGMRLADALDYASRQGVLHRDVKPANVVFDADGTAKLTDFNVSFNSKSEGDSAAAFFGGTLAYMSPEQLDACNPSHPTGPEDLRAASDIYSLGVLLWELLTCKRPFPDEQLELTWAETLGAMAERRRRGVPPVVIAGLPRESCPGLQSVLQRCLDPEPAQRPSGQEVVRQLALCLEPRTLALFDSPRIGWQSWVRAWPVTLVLVAAVLPNVVAAVFNFAYNRQEIVSHLRDAEPTFMRVQLTINCIAFPAGMILLALLTAPVARAVRQSAPGKSPPVNPDLNSARQRCLWLGHYAAVISLAGWLSAGLAYPIGMSVALGHLPLEPFLHFIGSLALCGLIVAVYPFFCVTVLSVRALFPALARTEGDPSGFLGLNRLMGFYLLLAAAVPMLAVVLLVVIGSHNRFALGVMGAAGLAGFGLAFALYRILLNDLQALSYALRSAEEMLQATGGAVPVTSRHLPG
jgi:serine/threonine protein kinase